VLLRLRKLQNTRNGQPLLGLVDPFYYSLTLSYDIERMHSFLYFGTLSNTAIVLHKTQQIGTTTPMIAFNVFHSVSVQQVTSELHNSPAARAKNHEQVFTLFRLRQT
jgi:hypothetical protein